jgi:hypothetical protein
MNDEQHLLASAYADGHVTADERRLAEADPDVMSEVEQLLDLGARIGAVEPPAPAARESAIAAAMAEFAPAAVGHLDAATTRGATTSNAAVFRHRPWSTRYLRIAAGFVAVGMLGAVVVSSLRAGGDDDAASDPVADESAALSVEEPTSSRILESTEGGVDAVADDATSDLAAAELAPAEPAADDAVATPGLSRPQIDATQPLTTPAELGSYGTHLLELEQAGQLPPTPNTKCPQPGVLGSTQYLFDDLPVDVLVAVDDIARTTTAIDPATCRVLVVGPLF